MFTLHQQPAFAYLAKAPAPIPSQTVHFKGAKSSEAALSRRRRRGQSLSGCLEQLLLPRERLRAIRRSVLGCKDEHPRISDHGAYASKASTRASGEIQSASARLNTADTRLRLRLTAKPKNASKNWARYLSCSNISDLDQIGWRGRMLLKLNNDHA